MPKTPPLDGIDILLVEDDELIGLDLTMTFEEAGATVRGPFATVEAAMGAIEAEDRDKPDCAVPRFRLGQQTCDDIAIALSERNIPFVLHTGDPDQATGLASQVNAVVVAKPAETDDIVNAVLDNLV